MSRYMQNTDSTMDRHFLAFVPAALAMAITLTQLEQMIRVCSAAVFLAIAIVTLMYRIRKYRRDR